MKTKKYYRIKSKFRFTVFVVFIIVLTAFLTSTILGLNDAASLSEEPNYHHVQVQAGDTLWNIAAEYGPPNTDRRKVIYEICLLNEIDANSLQPGQSILVPEKI